MNPRDPQNSSKPSQRDLSVPSRDAAANVVRGQLDAIYGSPEKQNEHRSEPAVKATPPASTASQPKADSWEHYHTAWQEYYQKYYAHYYADHVNKILSDKAEQPASEQTSPENASKPSVESLRSKIQDTVQQNAKKARKSRHFIPVSAAIVVMFVFAFLQYNSVLIGTVQAYVSPGAIDPQNIVVDPTATAQVGPEAKLIIPKINVDVPVVYGVGNDHDSQMAAMSKGVAHFAIPGANSVPGQIGNTAISGHSSNDLFEPGDYKFVFAQLEKLENGDTIYANYEGTRYTYTITKKEIVAPSEVAKLTYPTEKPILTLITCWPLGTANKRLLVTAEQVSPDPAKAAPAGGVGSGDANMPGNSATALEKLFGRR
jgi:sortase A